MQTRNYILPTGEALRKYRPMLNALETDHGIRRVDVVQLVIDPILEYLSDSKRMLVFLNPGNHVSKYDLMHQIYSQRLIDQRIPREYANDFTNLFMDILLGSAPFIGEIVKQLPSNLERGVRFMVAEILYEDVVIEVFYH